MTIGSRQNLANAKFMNLVLDNRPIEHKPTTKLLGVHIDVVLPMMVNTERLRPKGVSFSGFRYMKGLGISLVEVD